MLLYDDYLHWTDCNKNPAFCHLELYQTQTQTIAIATELANNPGQSITNDPAGWANAILSQFGIDPSSTVFVEHYDARSYGDPNEGDRYAQVHFSQVRGKLSNPQFQHLDPDKLNTSLKEITDAMHCNPEETWIPIHQLNNPIPGQICVLVVDGKVTQRKAWLPLPTELECRTQTNPIDTNTELPF